MTKPLKSDGSRSVADSHLTYIQAAVATRYDVYWRNRRGVQLGYVERSRRGWRAVDFDSGAVSRSDARWVAAVALWPEDES